MPHIEGRHDQSGWLLIDLGRCVIHLFTPEIREQYDLEGLWKSVPLDPSLPMPGQE
jgi:ribosomal silencing factor RsfS